MSSKEILVLLGEAKELKIAYESLQTAIGTVAEHLDSIIKSFTDAGNNLALGLTFGGQPADSGKTLEFVGELSGDSSTLSEESSIVSKRISELTQEIKDLQIDYDKAVAREIEAARVAAAEVAKSKSNVNSKPTVSKAKMDRLK